MDHPNDLSYTAYLKTIRAGSTSSNGISGIKLHYYQFAELPKKMEAIEDFQGLSNTELMRRMFPRAKYIWLTRRDKARQAISYLLASRTDEWWSIEDSTKGQRSQGTCAAEFDPHEIARLEDVLKKNDCQWQAYFRESGIVPLVVQYEDLATDYTGTIVGVLRWLGIPDADKIIVPPSRLRRQSDSRNEDWLRRYMALEIEIGSPEHDNAAAEITSPLFERSQRLLNRVADEWKQWIARQKLLKTPGDAIVEVLTSNGHGREAAIAEVGRAASDPYLRVAAQSEQRLKKVLSFLNISQQLARLDPIANRIERRSGLTRDQFRDCYYATNRPVVLTGLMTDWRAITAWTPEYLKRFAGEQMVEVMTGREADPRYEMNGRKHREEMRFADYIDLVFGGKVTNDYYLVANNGLFQRSAMRPLLDDLVAFPEYLTKTNVEQQCFLWFGPAGTVTPLHYDTSNILLAQVAGRKRYRLISPMQWQFVYHSEGVFSDVDCENPDLNRYPEFRKASIIDVFVEPGEVLFMPVGWWHHVRALDVSMTVSFTNFVFPNYFNWS